MVPLPRNGGGGPCIFLRVHGAPLAVTGGGWFVKVWRLRQ